MEKTHGATYIESNIVGSLMHGSSACVHLCNLLYEDCIVLPKLVYTLAARKVALSHLMCGVSVV